MKTTNIAKIMAILSAALLAATPAYAATVEMHTSKGLLVIEVYDKKAPATAENFRQYVEDGFFDDLIFHRVIPGFVIQGGGFSADMKRRETRPPIKNESDNGEKNFQYTLSMARTNDPNSATSQFFINLQDNEALDPTASNPGYAVFGKVVEGQDIVDAIATVKTQTFGHFQDVPVQPVFIEKAVVVK